MGSKALGSEPQSSRVRPEFERIALLLQGGGALGSYQAGVYQALAEADLHPHWVAGISIGAINSALIAGNAKDQRVLRLREFWETVTQGPFGLPYLAPMEIKNDFVHQFISLTGQSAGARIIHQSAAIDQHPDDFFDVERIALCALRNALPER